MEKDIYMRFIILVFSLIGGYLCGISVALSIWPKYKQPKNMWLSLVYGFVGLVAIIGVFILYP